MKITEKASLQLKQLLKPGECFFAKLGNTEIDDVNADSSSGSIQAQVFAICDDGGV